MLLFETLGVTDFVFVLVTKRELRNSKFKRCGLSVYANVVFSNNWVEFQDLKKPSLPLSDFETSLKIYLLK
jgi:hypothetical protein